MAFIKTLTPKELLELRKYFKRKKELTIKEVINNPDTSIRLLTSLDIYSKKYPEVNYVKDINKNRFLEIRNTGERSWNELSELINKVK